MVSAKILLIISTCILIGLSGCTNISKYRAMYVLSSSIKDNDFIHKSLVKLSSEDLLKEIANLGVKVSSSEQNAKAGKLIKSYFSSIGLEKYKNYSYYDPFRVEKEISFIDKKNSSEYQYKNGRLENIIGKISGQDSSKAIVISAHFDTFINTIGVIDNSSGVTALLKIAKEISYRLKNKSFPVDILFVGFNGGENGLLGSSSLVKDLKEMYSDFYNINIDCVGLKDRPLAYANKNIKSEELYKSLRPYLDKYNIELDDTLDYLNVGPSDHAPFQNDGKAAIIIGEDLQDGIIHTSRDNNLDLIDHDELMNLVNAISDFVIEGNGKIY